MEQLKKRLKSFLWRLSGMIIVAILGFVISPDVVSTLKLPAIMVMVIGLVMGELTKYLNTGRE